jgi:hypothetical protein
LSRLPDGAAENESAVGVARVQDSQRLIQPPSEGMDELDHAGNGCAGVEEGEAVVVLAAAVGEHGGVVASAEQAPHGDGFVLCARSGDQLVRLALDKLLRVGSLLIGQCSWSRRAPRAQQKGQGGPRTGHMGRGVERHLTRRASMTRRAVRASSEP